MYNIHVWDTVEQHLSSTQFAYRTGGSCTNALLSMQHTIHCHLDNPKCKIVYFFALDFSKVFDNINHELLSYMLKSVLLNPFIINWYTSFIENRQHCIHSSFQEQWKWCEQGHNTGQCEWSVFI